MYHHPAPNYRLHYILTPILIIMTSPTTTAQPTSIIYYSYGRPATPIVRYDHIVFINYVMLQTVESYVNNHDSM